MALILDTNALSALAEGDVVLRRAIAHEPIYAVPVVALGEFLFETPRFRAQLSARRPGWAAPG